MVASLVGSGTGRVLDMISPAGLCYLCTSLSAVIDDPWPIGRPNLVHGTWITSMKSYAT